MKAILGILTLCLSITVFGAVNYAPTDMGTLLERNLLTQPLSSSTWATLGSSMLGKTKICLINGGTTAVYFSTNNSSCSGSPTINGIVPASGTACLEGARVKGAICLKLSSTTVGFFGMNW